MMTKTRSTASSVDPLLSLDKVPLVGTIHNSTNSSSTMRICSSNSSCSNSSIRAHLVTTGVVLPLGTVARREAVAMAEGAEVGVVMAIVVEGDMDMALVVEEGVVVGVVAAMTTNKQLNTCSDAACATDPLRAFNIRYCAPVYTSASPHHLARKKLHCFF